MKLFLSYFFLLGVQPLFFYGGQEIDLSSFLDNRPMVSDTLIGQSTAEEPEKENLFLTESPSLLVDRLQCIEQTIPLTYDDRVHSFIDYFTIRDREYVEMVMNRVDLYFPLFSKYLAQYNLPDELKYLAIVESGLNPTAKSRAGAVGLWQFMPSTGQDLGLSKNRYVDERRDPEKSTEAACKYLAKLHTIFKDWELVLMAYNSGPGTVIRARRRAGYPKQAKKIYRYLPRETRSYLSQFVAIDYTLNYGTQHALFACEKEPPIAYDTLAINGPLHLPTFASLTAGTLEDLTLLNPSILRVTTSHEGNPRIIKIPAQAKEILNKNRLEILDSALRVGQREIMEYISKEAKKDHQKKHILYRVKPGDVLGSISRRFHVPIHDIQRWNKLKSTIIKSGQHLDLWVSHTVKHSAAAIKRVPPISYTVTLGDTLWDISCKFKGLSVDKIIDLNQLQSSRVYPGQKLTLR